jgi:potassium efflux system protein
MNVRPRFRQFLGRTVAPLLVRCLLALGVAAAPGPAVGAQPQAPAPAVPEAPAIDAVQARVAELEVLAQAGQLDDEGRTRLQLYREALAALVRARDASEQRARYESELGQLPGEQEAVKAELAQPPSEPKPQPPSDATLAQLQQSFDQAQADLKAARDKLKELEGEPARRETRLSEIPEQIAGAQQALEEVEQQLASLPRPEESPQLTDARRARLQAERRAFQEQIAAWEKERQNYDARKELLPQRRERWVRRAAAQEKLVKAWQDLVELRRAADIRRQQQEASRAAARAHPLVAPIAQANADLVAKRDEVRPESQRVQDRLDTFQPGPEELRRQIDRLREKVEAVGLTSTVGLLLRKNRTALPDLREHRRNIKLRQEKMAQVEFDRLYYEDEREAVEAGRERRVEEILEGLGPTVPEQERSDIEKEAREQLRIMSGYLADLNADYNQYFNRLQALNEKERAVVELTEEIAGFIDVRILWIRSATPLRPQDARRTADAARWLASPVRWGGLGAALVADARSRWPVIAPLALLLAALIAVRARFRGKIRAVATRLSRAATDTFGRTIEVTLYTLVRAAVWPVALLLLAAWLPAAEPSGEFAHAIAAGLRSAAVLLFLLQFLRELCRSRGLAEAHFRWRPQNLRPLRRHLVWLMAVTVPGTFVVAAMQDQPNEAYEGSLGRLAFIVTMIAVAVFVARILRPRGGILHEYMMRRRGGWIDRLRYVWYPLAVAVPVVLAVASFVGYHYSAVNLIEQLGESVALVLTVLLLHGLMLRWLFVAQRRLALEDARKRRAAAAAAAEAHPPAGGQPASGEVPAVPEGEAKPDISAISAQTRQLLQSLVIFALLVGFWAIWADAFPAIGFLREIELWSRTGKAAAEAVGAVVAMVTLADLLLALLVLAVTVIVSKNIPGLLEIAILQRLPMDPGGRFAITTTLRYAITIAGVIVAFTILGWTWSRVQWIAAAITFGLGFGLQEIFANFVSGLIILFERPVRVGDFVTVGETSGKVTRIRIRATTVTDWDWKELIIPNKDFVTGRIINWTLSDPILRLVIPVGIAYGSDTVLAERLLLKTARDHPIVLDEPEPTVVFSGFGDSSLQFNLRVFIPHIDHLIPVRHALHNAVDQAFRKAGVEIAFPQRDIHIRSVKAGLPVDVRTSEDAAAAPPES